MSLTIASVIVAAMQEAYVEPLELQSEKVSKTGNRRNRKSEIRNPKPERNPKVEIRKIHRLRSRSGFGFVLAALTRRRSGSDFGFRVSDFEKVGRLQHGLTKIAIGGFLAKERKQDMKCGALVRLAFDANGPAMLLNDAPRNRKAQASSASLGAKKWTKQTADIFAGNSNSIILNGDAQSSRLAGMQRRAGSRTGRNRLSRHCKATAWSHGFDCIEQQIHEGLFQLKVVTAQEIAGSAVLQLQLNGLITKLPLNQAQRMIQDVVQTEL